MQYNRQLAIICLIPKINFKWNSGNLRNCGIVPPDNSDHKTKCLIPPLLVDLFLSGTSHDLYSLQVHNNQIGSFEASEIFKKKCINFQLKEIFIHSQNKQSLIIILRAIECMRLPPLWSQRRAKSTQPYPKNSITKVIT